MTTAKQITEALKNLSNPRRAKLNQQFFRTGAGEYGEGDVFLGIAVPDVRAVAAAHTTLSLNEVKKLLQSKYHEVRLAALVILADQFKKVDEKQKEEVYRFYLANRQYVNNWDLVDASAYKIVGTYLLNKDRLELYKLSQSTSLWDRRIAIVSTMAFIKNGQTDDTFKLTKLLINDKHDLIHKAVGWMLREAGKVNINSLEAFLKENYKNMPRTMLRYSVERLPEERRKAYLIGIV